MTICIGAPAERFAEPYLQGTLPEDEAARFEEHYFDCAVCLAQVEALQAVTAKLRTEPRARLKTPVPWPIRISAVAAIAAMLVTSFLVLRAHQQSPQPAVAQAPGVPMPQLPAQQPVKPTTPAASVSQLADLTLPPFRGSTLRGAGANVHFEAGMQAYGKKDCAGAVSALERVPATDEDGRAAKFYGGVCQMHDGDLAGAARSLRAVVQAGDSPQQEAALYYLAQIALAGNDATTARHYLARTISLHGDFERRARSQLNHVRSDETGQ